MNATSLDYQCTYISLHHSTTPARYNRFDNAKDCRICGDPKKPHIRGSPWPPRRTAIDIGPSHLTDLTCPCRSQSRNRQWRQQLTLSVSASEHWRCQGVISVADDDWAGLSKTAGS